MGVAGRAPLSAAKQSQLARQIIDRCPGDSYAQWGAPLAEWVGAVQKEWLVRFLEAPTVIRPSGVMLGDGVRHPQYTLSAKERGALSRALWRQRIRTKKKQEPKPLPPSRSAAVSDLLKARYGCLGCHQLNHEGGRIGPSLDGVGRRLTPGAIWTVLDGGAASSTPWAHGVFAPYKDAQKDLWRFWFS